MRRQDLEQRVTRAAEAALAEQRFVSAIDVLLGLGWLAPSHLDQWRQPVVAGVDVPDRRRASTGTRLGGRCASASRTCSAIGARPPDSLCKGVFPGMES
jgi:hypothetical protein